MKLSAETLIVVSKVITSYDGEGMVITDDDILRIPENELEEAVGLIAKEFDRLSA